MLTKDVKVLLQYIELKGFKPETDQDRHVLGMARQAIMFNRELKWPEDRQLEAIYRRAYQ